MSWLARSLANSLNLDDDDDDDNGSASSVEENDVAPHESQLSPLPRYKIQNEEIEVEEQSLSPEQVAELPSRGVKEDLSELKQTLTRQLWGVASFLAPPPPPASSPSLRSSAQLNVQLNDRSLSNLNQSEQWNQSIAGDEGDPSDPSVVEGIRNDFTQIGRRLTTMASDYFPVGSGKNEEDNEMENENKEDELEEELNAVGITDEVLAFAGNIAHHPETWLDFPLDPDEDLDDFDMSKAQKEHAMAVEHLAPRLAALRIELCPCHMSDSYFWKVYFVLLHSRLNKNDAEILSTPQVMEARALWMKELQKQTKPEFAWCGRSSSHLKESSNITQEDVFPSLSGNFVFETMSPRTYASESACSNITDYETEKHPVESTEMTFVDKSVFEENIVSYTKDKDCLTGSSSKVLIPNFEEDEIEWPEDDDPEYGGLNGAVINVENEEDISFSDLEDINDNSVPSKPKIFPKGFETSKRQTI